MDRKSGPWHGRAVESDHGPQGQGEAQSRAKSGNQKGRGNKMELEYFRNELKQARIACQERLASLESDMVRLGITESIAKGDNVSVISEGKRIVGRVIRVSKKTVSVCVGKTISGYDIYSRYDHNDVGKA